MQNQYEKGKNVLVFQELHEFKTQYCRFKKKL
jgi:uncharacterized protein YheU (UPF0270 family)